MCNIFTQWFVYLQGFTRNFRIIRGNFAHSIKLLLKENLRIPLWGVTVWSFSATQADMLVGRRATRGSILSLWVSACQKFTLHRSKSACQHRRKLTRAGHSFLALLAPLLKEGFAFSFPVLEVVASDQGMDKVLGTTQDDRYWAAINWQGQNQLCHGTSNWLYSPLWIHALEYTKYD